MGTRLALLVSSLVALAVACGQPRVVQDFESQGFEAGLGGGSSDPWEECNLEKPDYVKLELVGNLNGPEGLSFRDPSNDPQEPCRIIIRLDKDTADCCDLRHELKHAQDQNALCKACLDNPVNFNNLEACYACQREANLCALEERGFEESCKCETTPNGPAPGQKNATCTGYHCFKTACTDTHPANCNGKPLVVLGDTTLDYDKGCGGNGEMCCPGDKCCPNSSYEQIDELSCEDGTCQESGGSGSGD